MLKGGALPCGIPPQVGPVDGHATITSRVNKGFTVRCLRFRSEDIDRLFWGATAVKGVDRGSVGLV